jgi:hypothetical protein
MIKKTLVLRITLLITAAVLILFGFLMGVQLFTSESDVFTVVYIAVGVIWIDMILGLFIVYALNKLLTLIDRNEIFSDKTLVIMSRIQKLTLGIAVATIGLMPFFFTIAQLDDAPGLVLFGAGIVFIPCAIHVLVVVMKETLSKAVSIKQENELTI